MLPISRDGTVVTDAQGRQIRIKVEYLAPIVAAPPQSAPPAPPPPEPALVVKPLGVGTPAPVVVSSEVVAAPPRPAPAPRPAPVPVVLVPPPPPKPPAPPAPKDVFDHPRVGGRFTVCALLYGDYYDMHRRCLDAILASCPPARVELRVGSNQLGARSLDYVRGLERDARVRRHYAHPENARKYPVMREMFWDPAAPLATDWVVWFDDDSFCDRNRDWLALLAQQIVAAPDADMVGPVKFYRLTPGQAAWVRAAPWYRGRPFRDRGGKPAPNGDKVHFAVGAFWALRTEALRLADVPCRRLGHNGGDWTIGEQLHQAGFRLKSWTTGKEVVEWSAVPRRGLSEKHPGL